MLENFLCGAQPETVEDAYFLWRCTPKTLRQLQSSTCKQLHHCNKGGELIWPLGRTRTLWRKYPIKGWLRRQIFLLFHPFREKDSQNKANTRRYFWGPNWISLMRLKSCCGIVLAYTVQETISTSNSSSYSIDKRDSRVIRYMTFSVCFVIKGNLHKFQIQFSPFLELSAAAWISGTKHSNFYRNQRVDT